MPRASNPEPPGSLFTGGPGDDLDRLNELRAHPDLTPDQRERIDRLIAGLGAQRERVASGATGLSWPSRETMEAVGGMAGPTVLRLASRATPPLAAATTAAGVVGGLAGLASDVAQGKTPTLREAAMGFVRPAAGEAVIPALWGATKLGGRLVGKAGTRLARGLGLVEKPSARLAALERGEQASAQELIEASRQFDVPLSPGDIYGTKRRRALEAMGSFFAIGSNYVQRVRRLQLAGAGEEAYKVLTNNARREMSEEAAGLIAQGGIRAAAAKFRNENLARLDELQRLAGDAEVPVPGLKRLARQLFELGEETPLGPPQGAKKLTELGVPPEMRGMRGALQAGEGQIRMGGAWVRVDKLGPDTRQALLDLMEKDTIPFALARALEAELGQLAFGGKRKVIGTIAQGRMGALYGALQQDFTEWLESDLTGKAVAPALRAYKDWYKPTRRLFNEGIVDVMKRMPPQNIQQIPGKLFQPGNHQAIQDAREVFTTEAFYDLREAWAQAFLRKHTGAEAGRKVFHAASAGRDLGRYVEDGTIDLMYGPQWGGEIRTLTKLLTALQTAEKIAGVKQGTGEALLSSGQVLAVSRALGALLLRSGTLAVAGAAGGAAVGGLSPWAMLPGALSMALVPPAVAVATLSPAARRLGTQAAPPLLGAAWSAPRRVVGQVGAQVATGEQ